MLSHGSLPTTEYEDSLLAALVSVYGPVSSLTRRDPGNTGPLLVEFVRYPGDQRELTHD